MTVGSQKDIDGLKAIGKVVALTIAEMKKNAKAGMTTRELDEIGRQVLERHGAVSAPRVTYRFPGYTCISINQDIAHGIPGDRVIKPGDLVNIDVSAALDGYFADSGHSFQMKPHAAPVVRLCQYTHYTMMKVIHQLKDGVPVNEVGKIIQTEARKGGYKIIRNLCSHGIGKALHEAPTEIQPVYNKHDKRVFRDGMVVTIEPFLSTGAEYVTEMADGWTLRVPGHSLAAQHEHTIIITKDKPVILTAV